MRSIVVASLRFTVGITTVPSGAVLKILPSQEAKSSTVETIFPGKPRIESDEFVTQLIPLQNVDVNNMLGIIQPLVSANGLLAAYTSTNTMIIIDSAANIDRIIEGYDVVIDGADNFPTRYLLNDASVKHRIPVVHGSIFRFEGQVTVFKPFEGPCYRCLFPEPPPPELAPSCAEAGVLGVLPGVIGTVQATEAIKLLLGIGEPLVGRYLL